MGRHNTVLERMPKKVTSIDRNPIFMAAHEHESRTKYKT